MLVSHLKNNEHYDFHEVIIGLMQDYLENIKPLSMMWAIFTEQFEKEVIIYKRYAKAVETKYIREVERWRKDAFLSIKLAIESASYSVYANKRDAALILAEVMENYKQALTAPITEVTSLVFNLIKDLRKEQYKKPVETLTLTAAIDALEIKNEELKMLYVQRAQHLGEYVSQGSMKKARLRVDRAFNKFADAVDALYGEVYLEGKPDADNRYSPVVDILNSYIDQYRHIYSRRIALLKGREDEI
jgi:hypothetical protein